MAYTFTTFGELKTQLAARLGDTGKVFWVDEELGLYLIESLRTFGLLSAFWRERAVIDLDSGTAFYDLRDEITNLASTVTDQDIILDIQYALLESTGSQSAWTGTSQFTYEELEYALQHRLDQFLSDTGILLTRNTQIAAVTPRQAIDETIIDIRRMAWLNSVTGYYSQVWREDEFSISSGDPQYGSTQGTPSAFSVMSPPPIQLELYPVPDNAGTMDMLTVEVGATLDPSAGATELGIPDDLTPAIKWGVLADLLGKEGSPANDAARSAFCEERYQQYVQLARILSCVLGTYVGGVANTIPSTLFDLDTAHPGWQNSVGTPTHVAVAGWNMVAVYPVPNLNYTFSADIVRNADVPDEDDDDIQIGREQLGGLLDYAQHLAMFKVGGAELEGTMHQAQNFLIQAMSFNNRLSASARYIITPKQYSFRESINRPRMKDADGLGSLPSSGQDPGPNKQRVPKRL